MFCEKCGNEMSDAAMFCPKCGHKRNIDSDTTSSASGAGQAGINEYVNIAKTKPRENPKFTKYIMAGVGILLLILIISSISKHSGKSKASEEDMASESFENSEDKDAGGTSAEEFVDSFLNAMLTYNADKVVSYYAPDAPYNHPQLEEELGKMYQMSRENQKIWFDYEMPSTAINKSGYDEAYNVTVTVYRSEYKYGGTAETYWPEQLVIGRKGNTWYVLEQMYVIYMPDWHSYRS